MSMTGMDYSMGGGRLKYRKIATAAGSQTYAQQLTQLKTTWNTLTDEEKMRCVICHEAGLYLNSNYYGLGFFATSFFNGTYAMVYTMDIINVAYKIWNNSSGGSVTDYTNNSNAKELYLMILDVVSE